MNLTAYHPLGQFDLLAIGVALVVVMAIIGWRILTGRPWRRTLPPDEIDVKPDGEVVAKDAAEGQRRSIYVQQRRSKPVTMLEAFDAPQLKPNCLRRSNSTVASQALQMMNSEILRTSSRYMAGRVIDAVGEDPAAQVDRLYVTALGRPPSLEERTDGVFTLTEMTKAWGRRLDEQVPMEPKRAKARWLALATLCHTVLNSAEFLYID